MRVCAMRERCVSNWMTLDNGADDGEGDDDDRALIVQPISIMRAKR